MKRIPARRAWSLFFATAALVLSACGGAPTSDPTAQSNEAVSTAAPASTLPSGHCEVVYSGRRLLQTGLCVLDGMGADSNPVCQAVESPQCALWANGNAYNCACGSYPSCTFVDTVDCAPAVEPDVISKLGKSTNGG